MFLFFNFFAGALASPWLPDPGQARVSLGFQQLSTATLFASPEEEGLVGPLCPEGGVMAGERAPFDCTTGGRFRNQSVFLDASVGVHDAIAVDVALPVVVGARFEDSIGRTDARGLGDVRFGLRVGHRWGGWALAGAVHAKAPTGPAGLVDRDVPLGEAQWDVVPGVRVGRSLGRWGWLETHQQFGIRLKSQRSGINPGEEWTGNVGGGWAVVQPAGLSARAEWIWAAQERDGFGLAHPGRRLLQLRAGPFVRKGPWWAEVGITAPLMGRRWPGAMSWGGALAFTAG